MGIDFRHLTGFIVIATGAAVVGMSYLAVYLLGKNAVAIKTADGSELRRQSADGRRQ